jgi:hypothetical protein
MRGRKPPPTKFRELVGHPQYRPLNAAEPEYPTGAGEPPEPMDDIGRANPRPLRQVVVEYDGRSEDLRALCGLILVIKGKCEFKAAA